MAGKEGGDINVLYNDTVYYFIVGLN